LGRGLSDWQRNRGEKPVQREKNCGGQAGVQESKSASMVGLGFDFHKEKGKALEKEEKKHFINAGGPVRQNR